MRKGFTLIELIMVILILGILALIAAPKFFNLDTDNKKSAEKSVIGAVQAGIAAYYSLYKVYPTILDSAVNGACVGCFYTAPSTTSILTNGGITGGGWSKAGLVYTGPTGNVCTYTPGVGVGAGNFKCLND